MGGDGPLRIAFISAGDPRDKQYSSGVYHYMARALREQGCELHFLGPAKPAAYDIGKTARHASRLLLHKNYDFLHSVRLARGYARIFGRLLAQGSYDVVFAPEASTEVAYLETDIPIVYASDTTFSLAVDYYPFYTNLLRSSIRQGNILEAKAISKAAAVIYPTNWAARSANHDYAAHRDKVHVIPHGANLDTEPRREEVLSRTRTDICRLLLVGVDWVRKGGNIAVDTLLALENMGVTASLTICGCTPPSTVRHPHLTVIPYLNKNDKRQEQQLAGLFKQADFLLLPSRAENAGFVLSEAAAYGLPVLAFSTGGIPDIIRDGISGFLLPLEADGRAFAQKIREAFLNEESYYELRRASRTIYEESLNWKAWGERVKRVMEVLA